MDVVCFLFSELGISLIKVEQRTALELCSTHDWLWPEFSETLRSITARHGAMTSVAFHTNERPLESDRQKVHQSPFKLSETASSF